MNRKANDGQSQSGFGGGASYSRNNGVGFASGEGGGSTNLSDLAARQRSSSNEDRIQKRKAETTKIMLTMQTADGAAATAWFDAELVWVPLDLASAKKMKSFKPTGGLLDLVMIGPDGETFRYVPYTKETLMERIRTAIGDLFGSAP